MQLGVFISLVPMSKIRKNAMFLSLWSPGSTAGLYDMCNLNFRQTLEQTILMCAFLHWILAVCNVYWILRLCWPYLFSRHWWQSYGLENAVLLAAFSLDPVPACCGSAQQCPCCTLEPRATCLTTHVEVRFPRCVHMSHKPHANTHMQHLSKYHENSGREAVRLQEAENVTWTNLVSLRGENFSFQHTFVACCFRDTGNTLVWMLFSVCVCLWQQSAASSTCCLPPWPDETPPEWRRHLLPHQLSQCHTVFPCVWVSTVGCLLPRHKQVTFIAVDHYAWL